MKKLKSYIDIVRPVNVIITFLVVYVAGIICGGEILFSLPLLFAAVSASFTAAAGNVINDIFDLEIDIINRPLRPLPSGIVVKSEAIIYYISLVFISLAVSLTISFPAVLIVILTNLILFLYSKYLKSVPLIGNISVSVCTGLAFIFGGIAVGSVENSMIPAIFAFFITIIREIIKDIEDIKGDSINNQTTLPVKYGLGITKRILVALILSLIFATIYPFITGEYKIEYLILVLFLVDLPLVYLIREIYSGDFKDKLSFLSLKLKVLMIFGLIAIFVGIY